MYFKSLMIYIQEHKIRCINKNKLILKYQCEIQWKKIVIKNKTSVDYTQENADYEKKNFTWIEELKKSFKMHHR